MFQSDRFSRRGGFRHAGLHHDPAILESSPARRLRLYAKQAAIDRDLEKERDYQNMARYREELTFWQIRQEAAATARAQYAAAGNASKSGPKAGTKKELDDKRDLVDKELRARVKLEKEAEDARQRRQLANDASIVASNASSAAPGDKKLEKELSTANAALDVAKATVLGVETRLDQSKFELARYKTDLNNAEAASSARTAKSSAKTAADYAVQAANAFVEPMRPAATPFLKDVRRGPLLPILEQQQAPRLEVLLQIAEY